MAAVEIVKPFLKWVGGQTQIINEVLADFPREMSNYHEPFVGGGSVLLALLSHVRAGRITLRGTVYASDVNANLIALYRNIQTHPDALITELRTLITEFTAVQGHTVNRGPKSREEAMTSPESYYFWIRGRFNALADRTTPAASAMMLFMNKTCFRGVYREGPRGFNVPYGNYKSPAILDESHIRAVSDLIRDVVFTVRPFAESLAIVRDTDDFVYMDPPYAPETATSFVGYTADGFKGEDHATLFGMCAALTCPWLMSNADVPLVRSAFPAPTYTTRIVECRRAINSRKPDAKTNEVLITHPLV